LMLRVLLKLRAKPGVSRSPYSLHARFSAELLPRAELDDELSPRRRRLLQQVLCFCALDTPLPTPVVIEPLLNFKGLIETPIELKGLIEAPIELQGPS
jgi:hypothetical protein